MPRGAWSAKRERQYAHIKSSCLAAAKRAGECPCTSKVRCTRIAAATVNRDRTRAGETKAARAARKRRAA